MPKRYAICGLSHRALSMYVGPPFEDGYGEVVAVIDPDTARVAAWADRNDRTVPTYTPGAFDRMVHETAPDAVIVASPDATHVDYILQALAHGLDVITEKPLTATSAQAIDVLAAEARSSGSIRVAHNFRYVPRHRQIKRIIKDGLIGRPVRVDLAYNVDTYHGASYFTRWNRRRAVSGGLSVHKSCHHLDLVSWWLDDAPAQAFAYGARNYFGPDSPHNPGRHLTAEQQRIRCPYHRRWPALGERTDDLPYPVQYPPGQSRYLYDEEIDVEDSYSAVLRFRDGAALNYSITFSAPWEGYRLIIDGTHGRIETTTARLREGPPMAGTDVVTYYPLFGSRQVHDAATAPGGHDGADLAMHRDLFTDDATETRDLGCPATAIDGAYAVAAGEAIWRSARDNRPVDIDALLGRGEQA